VRIGTVAVVFLALMSSAALAQEEPRIEVEMDTARIQSVKELPMLLYIVPWKDTELSTSQQERRIVIHDLFGDFYDPVMPRSVFLEEKSE